MSKKTNKITEKVLLGLAIGSVIIAFIEGVFYYNAESYPNMLVRYMLILQNTIRAFGFKSDIGIKDVAKVLQESTFIIEIIINYIYLIVLFIAPYCTVSYVYKFLDKIFRLRREKRFKSNDGVVIFGYNEEVKSLLKDYQKSIEKMKAKDNQKDAKETDGYRIHLVAENISNDDEMQLLKSGVTIHKIDCLKLPSDQLEYFFTEMKLPMAKNIIFFDESSARNFSLFKMFHDEKKIVKLKEDVKFFCRCENDGIRTLLEDFQDSQKMYDMETLSIPELRVRKTLKMHPLHTYYLSKPDVPVKNWDLHLLIIGFGKLGQQMLLQAMNQGVVSSTNKILVDVVDFDIDKKSSIFANTFSEDYVQIEDGKVGILSNKADGEFQIRFHKMDIRYKQFYNLLKACAERDGIYTYAAICIEDEEVGIHCLTEVQRYLRKAATKKEHNYIPIAIRMEMDKYMKAYLNSNDKTFSNVIAFEENKDVITLEELFHDKLDEEAKEYNRIYNRIEILNVKELKESVKENTVGDSTKKSSESPNFVKDIERKQLWRTLELFKRDSNRALAEHSMIKEIVWKKMLEENPCGDLKKWFGKDGSILKEVETTWVYENEDIFVQQQSDRKMYPTVSEMSRLEHRRWCYFMASRGWSSTSKNDVDEEGKRAKKISEAKKNICMCTWDDLVEVNQGTCKYDLMWLLKKCSEN